MTLKDYKKSSLLLAFEQYLKGEKKAAPNTQASYMRDLEQFDQWLRQRGREDMTCLTRDSIEAYAAYLEAAGKSAATITRCIASIHSLCRWMCMTGRRQDNPSDGFKTKKAEKKLPRILTGAEVERLLAQPECVDDKGWRDRAMLELLYATGLRVSELVALNVSDLNLSLGVVHCVGRNRERVVPIYAGAVKALRDYLRRVRPRLADPDEEALFVNMNGRRMTRQGFWKLLKTYQEKAGIETEITPHTLRHSFAAHLLENGADLQSVQELLGHVERASTQVYAQMLDQRLKEVYEKAHPLG